MAERGKLAVRYTHKKRNTVRRGLQRDIADGTLIVRYTHCVDFPRFSEKEIPVSFKEAVWREVRCLKIYVGEVSRAPFFPPGVNQR